MTTTFNPAIAAPVSCRRIGRRAIIAALAAATLLVGGCGFAVKFGYNQGASLAFRWLDGYVEFDYAQSLRVRGGLDEWFAWHRRTQLPDYAGLLAKAQAEIQGEVTAERMCGWTSEFRSRVDAALERAVPTMADVMVTMSPQQIGNVEKKYAERNGEYRSDYLQRDLAKRKRAALEREIERAETLYGRLEPAQRDLIAKNLDASPFDAEASYAERLRRQQDVVAVLRRLTATRTATRADAEVEIRSYVQRLDRSPRDDYRRYSASLIEHNCSAAAQLQNTTTPDQRKRAARKLKGWEDDLRALAADAG